MNRDKRSPPCPSSASRVRVLYFSGIRQFFLLCLILIILNLIQDPVVARIPDRSLE